MKTVKLSDDARGNLAAILSALGLRAKPLTREAAQTVAKRAATELKLIYKGKETKTDRDWILYAAHLKPVPQSKPSGKQD